MMRPVSETEHAIRNSIVKDEMEWCSHLINDPEISKIFSIIGMSEDISGNFADIIFKKSGLERHFQEKYPKIPSIGYLAVVTSLARRITSGLFSSFEDKNSYNYCYENTLDPGNFWRINDRRVTPEQYSAVAMEFCQSSLVIENVARFQTHPPDGENEIAERMDPLDKESFRIFLKAGLITRSSVSGVPLYIEKEHLSGCTPEYALRYARAHIYLSRVEGILHDTGGNFV